MDFIEKSFLQIPIEQLKKSNRITLKWIEKEIKQTQVYNKDRLKKLKNKLDSTTQEEITNSDIVDQRIQHLDGISNNNELELNTRLNRWLVDYFVYLKCYQSAQFLMENANLSSLCDVELFKELQLITQKLENQNCDLLLKWCSDNRSLLKKSKSTLEFKCRQQEYVHLIKKKQIMQAIDYAREHFSSFASDHQQDIYLLMGLLTTQLKTNCLVYKNLLDEKQWDKLVAQFQTDFANIHGLTQHPILILSLQAGLAALKTNSCHPDKHPHCPVCTKDLFEFSKKLPSSHVTNTVLRCPITGAIMNEHNLPMVLPSGFVMSEQVLISHIGLSRNAKS
eukprot:NODE_428_length_7645_cov_0.433740.p4 type:complete len:336 gc:universal NODE_428_length_7645_cov_0.433740:3879-4886(+)